MISFDDLRDLAQRALMDPSEPELPPGTTDDAITGFEDRAGLVVPPGLRRWLKLTNGTSLGAGGIRGICTPHPADDIEQDYRLYPEWRDKGWIPIAGDGCGNSYVIATHSKDGPGNPVFFIECVVDCDRPVYVAASSFLHFLEFYLGRELGENGWPFQREEVLRKDPDLSLYANVPLPWDA